MITRIFRVTIRPELRQEFETKFAEVSVEAVKACPGHLSVSIGYPTKWTPDEYLMISEWENESALRNFAGESWNQAVIPPGMEKFLVKCRVHHYEDHPAG